MENQTGESLPQVPSKLEKALTVMARVVSGIFSPLLSGTYAMVAAMFLSYMIYSGSQAKFIVIFVTFLGTAILPVLAIFVLWKIGVVKDPALNRRQDRMVPYMITLAGYLAVAIYLFAVSAPLWLPMLLVGAAIALLADTIINYRWKISGHTSGMGGICAVIFFLMLSSMEAMKLDWWFILAIFLTGLVGTSRLILGRHNLWQVLAGFAVGFTFTLLMPWLFI